jgi:hypothetical protein
VETWKCTCAGTACPADGELGPRVKYDFHANVPTANEADAATKKDGTIDKMKALFEDYQTARNNDLASERAVEAVQDRETSLGEGIKSKFFSGTATWSWNSDVAQAAKDYHFSVGGPCFSQCMPSASKVTKSSGWTAGEVDGINTDCVNANCEDWSLASDCSLKSSDDRNEIVNAVKNNWSTLCSDGTTSRYDQNEDKGWQVSNLGFSTNSNGVARNWEDGKKQKKLAQLGIKYSDVATFGNNNEYFYHIRESKQRSGKRAWRPVFAFGFQITECTSGGKSVKGKVVTKNQFYTDENGDIAEETICGGAVSFAQADAFVRGIISDIRFERMKTYLRV